MPAQQRCECLIYSHIWDEGIVYCITLYFREAKYSVVDGCYTRLLRRALNVNWRDHVTNDTLSGLSVRAGGGGFLPATRVWCAGYEDRMKADIKSSQPEVKASKSVKRFQRYRQLKFSMFLPKFLELPGAIPLDPH